MVWTVRTAETTAAGSDAGPAGPGRRWPSRLAAGGVIAALLLLGGAPRVSAEDVIVKLDGGRLRGEIVDEDRFNVTIRTSAGVYKIPRSEISKVIKEGDLGDEFKKRWKSVDKYDPDKLFELGQWCESKKLEKEAKQCYDAALKIDSYHRRTREALGFRRYRGKWVTEEDYKRLARGLVKYKGEWMTPAEREMREQGYVQDDSGKWMRPEDIMRKREWERERKEASRREQEAEEEKSGKRKVPEDLKRARKRPKEDSSWYDDNTKLGPFTSAPAYESRWYKIKTNVKKEYAKRYGKMMDQYFKRFTKVFKSFMPKGQIPKSEIHIYSSQQEFMGATGMSQYTGGFYSTGNRRVTAYHGKFGMNGNTRTVLAHEGTHQFEHLVLGGGSFGNAPIWIIEGLAVFFESAYFNGKEVEIALVPHDRLSNLKRGAQQGTLIPFEQLIRTPQAQFSGYHYAHAWGLIYYMLYGTDKKSERKKRVKAFSDLLFLAKKRKVQPEDTERVFGGREAFRKFEEEWKTWIVELPYDFDPR